MQNIISNAKRYLMVMAVLLTGIIMVAPNKALAVETSAVSTGTFAAFNDGRWGWYKLVVERDTSLHKLRAKVAVWCEPNNGLGGTRVACDAIQFQNSTTDFCYDSTYVAVEYWNESLGWVPSDFGCPQIAEYNPSSAGISYYTAWDAPATGNDQYRARVNNFRAASTNQWSSWKEKVTPTWAGTP